MSARQKDEWPPTSCHPSTSDILHTEKANDLTEKIPSSLSIYIYVCMYLCSFVDFQLNGRLATNDPHQRRRDANETEVLCGGDSF